MKRFFKVVTRKLEARRAAKQHRRRVKMENVRRAEARMARARKRARWGLQ